MDLPDNYFRDRSPADIIAKVATITLANISLLGSDELKRIGWLNNPIIDILYSLTSAGVWIARTDTSGYVYTRDVNLNTKVGYAAEMAALAMLPQVSTVDIGGMTEAEAEKRVPRVVTVPYALVGGVQANLVLVADPADAYYPVIDSILILPTDSIAGGITCLFESPAGTGIFTLQSTALVDNVINRSFEDVRIYKTTDNEALTVDISGGAGVEAGFFIVFYHYET